MATKRSIKKSKRKRGPVEERLVIKGNPQTAIDKLLGKTPSKKAS